MKRVLITVLLSLLSACASVQAPSPEQRLTQQQLQQGAGGFLTAFFAGKLDDVLAASMTPFYLNHAAIMNTDAELRSTLGQLFQKKHAVPVEVLAFDYYSKVRLETERPKDLAPLIQFGYDDCEIWLVTLLLSPENSRPIQEKVLLLLNPINGKVEGFIQ